MDGRPIGEGERETGWAHKLSEWLCRPADWQVTESASSISNPGKASRPMRNEFAGVNLAPSCSRSFSNRVVQRELSSRKLDYKRLCIPGGQQQQQAVVSWTRGAASKPLTCVRCPRRLSSLSLPLSSSLPHRMLTAESGGWRLSRDGVLTVSVCKLLVINLLRLSSRERKAEDIKCSLRGVWGDWNLSLGTACQTLVTTTLPSDDLLSLITVPRPCKV